MNHVQRACISAQEMLRREVERRGGTVSYSTAGRYRVWQLEAPALHVWSCDPSVHCLKVEWRTIDHSDRLAALQDAIVRVRLGTEPCQVPECDYCNPEH
jgi:hypothetical protein